MKRRDFLRISAKAAAGLAASAYLLSGDVDNNFYGLPPARDMPFSCGVASGFGANPKTEMVLWTRVDPEPFAFQPVAVKWRLSSTPNLRTTVAEGESIAFSANDHSVHVDCSDLEPGHTYYYQFSIPATHHGSPVGRTRTIASDYNQVIFSSAACQDRSAGYYTAWENVAKDEELDFVLFLGDFIYEHSMPTAEDRWWGSQPDMANYRLSSADDLESFRVRYRLYLRDPNLRAARAQHPFVMMWDDHEIHDNYVGADESGSTMSAGRRAYYDFMPITSSAPSRLYRSLRFGDLLNLAVMDTRQFRSDSQMLGDAQQKWVLDQIAHGVSRGAVWTSIASPAPFTQMGKPYLDGWDAFAGDRAEILEALSRPSNVFILSGDLHEARVTKTRHANSRLPLGFEYTVGSVTSQSSTDRDLFDDIEFREPILHGHTRVVVGYEGMEASFIGGNTRAPNNRLRVLNTNKVEAAALTRFELRRGGRPF